MKSLKLLNIILMAVFVASCASQTAEVEDSSTMSGLPMVQTVSMASADGEGRVVIAASDELNYNVFKLTDPDRIIVDLIDAGLSPNVSDSIAGEGYVSEIQVSMIEDPLSSLVRVEIFLNESVNYLAGLDNGQLIVRLVAADMPAEDFSDEAGEPELSGDELSGDELADLEVPLEAPIPGESDNEIPELAPLPEVETEASEELALPEIPTADDEETALRSESDAPAAPSLDAEVPSLDLPPLPAPAPLPEAAPESAEAPSAPQSDEQTDEQTAMTEAPAPEAPPLEPLAEAPPAAEDTPAPEATPEPAPEVPSFTPVPLVTEEDEKEVAQKEEEEKRVIVEPEGPEVPLESVPTQDIPTTVFTEGTSLLGGLGNKVYTGKRVSLEFQDASVQDVLRLIADVSKLNIIIADDVKGTLTLKLVDVPWDQALDIILTSKGLDKVQHGNILRVAPIESLKKEREIALANDKAAKQLEPLRLKLFNVNYATAADMQNRIKNLLSERGTSDTDERTQTLIVEDIAENLSRIEQLIKVLDTQTPQVRIESRIVQANDRFTTSLGIQWGPALKLDSENSQTTGWQFPNEINVLSPNANADTFEGPSPGSLTEFAVDALPGNTTTGGSLGFRLGSVDEVFNLDLRLSYAENEQLARVVSRPSVTVLDNKTAKIIQGSRIPFLSSSSEGSNVQFQEAGIEITVTPKVTNDGAVILTVSTKSNEPGSENVGGNPIINIREAATEMLVKSGRTAVLGGVFRTQETEGRGGVPGLKDIPILGWAFKGESSGNNREEMLIFLTPYVLTDIREAKLAPASSADLRP